MLLYFTPRNDRNGVVVYGAIPAKHGSHIDVSALVTEGGTFENLTYEQLRAAGRGTIFVDPETKALEILPPGDPRAGNTHRRPA